ncbi:MAG: class I SAM-dependent methyltransferase [Oscillospiraceae bacterium]|jgi:2-polyprenyl-3-methyl-5-hydroxy-6-metoxy-1,4-benzoquinol methylase|nr:class I SAM-dependent methyltransferase [Oscillospiraceae bacterium]
MYIEPLKKTRLADNNRCGQLTLFTTGHSIEEIIELQNKGVKIVSFGCDNFNIFYIDSLKEIGISIDVISDNGLKITETGINNIPVISPRDLFKTSNDYYFIITLTDINYVNQVRKQLLLNNVHNFSILTLDMAFDFDSCKIKNLKPIFLSTINEIYQDIDFTANNFDAVRYVYINPIKWWYDTLEFIVSDYEKRGEKNLELLDIGPGTGLESLLYQKLLGCNVNWINLQELKATYSISHNPKIINAHKINVQYGYIESDNFTGEYDIIIFTDIIEHMAYNPVLTMKKLNGLLKNKGYLAISTPNRKTTKNYSSWRDMPNPPEENAIDVLNITGAGHVYEYNAAELEEIFAESGFKVVFKKETSKLQYVLSKE